MEAERYEEACPKLEESLRLDHGMGTQFNLAHCWDKLGRTASAWALFLDVAAAARAQNQSQRETAARERANALEPKLSRLQVSVTDPTPDTKVLRDDQEVGRAAWGTAVPIDPGEHTIRVTATGKEPWSQQITVPANSKVFSVTVPALVDLPVATAPKDAPPTETAPTEVGAEPRQRSGNSQKVAAYIVGGVGVAALATGTVFMVQSRQSNSEALKLCRWIPEGETEETCETPAEGEKLEELQGDAKSQQTIALIGFGVGGAALITGAVLYFTADDGAPSDTALNVAPLWTAGGWGASVSGTF